MMTLRKLVPSTLLGAALFACSAPPPPRDTTPTATASVVAPTDGALTPVPAPETVVARARLKSPAASARALAQMTGSPAEAAEPLFRGLVAELLGKRMLRLDVDARAMANEVALDGPVDLVVALAPGDRPEPSFIVSVPLKSYDGAVAAAGAAGAPGAGGVKLLGKKARGSCAITKAAGGARLLCGGSDGDLEALGPYATRTLAAEAPTGADITAILDVARIDGRFGGELRKILPSLPTLAARRYGTGNAIFDRALADGGRVVGEEAARLLADVDKVTLELKVDQKQGISLDASTAFRDKTSWIARTSFSVPPGPAPAVFWSGPKDASSGLFTTLGDPAGYADGIKLMKELVVGALASGAIGNDAERKKVAALLDFPLEKNAVVVGFSGSSRITKPVDPKTPKDKWQRAFAEMSGWSVVGTTLKPDAVSKWLKDLSAAFNQPGIQKAMKSQKDLTVTMKTGKAPAALGNGAALVEMRIQSKVDNSDATLLIVTTPGTQGAWIGIGVEQEELVERLQRAKDGKDPLKDRADLGPLRDGTATSGYFFSASTFKSSFLPYFMFKRPVPDAKKPSKPEDEILAAVGDLNRIFEALPQKGTAPAFFESTVIDGGKGTLKMSLTLPPATLTEVATLLNTLK